MLTEKAGTLAGVIWNALNGTEGLTIKQLKKATGLRSEKELYMAMGWLMREGKLETSEVEGDILVKLA